MACLTDLPAEVIHLVLTQLNPSQPKLAKLALVARCLTAPAQYLLFANASITSLVQFDALLDVLQPPRLPRRPPSADEKVDSDELGCDHDMDHLTSNWARALGTTRLRVECRNFGEKGWGTRLGRLLRLAANVQGLELRGIHDLRIKFLQGRGGTDRTPSGRRHRICTDSSHHAGAASLSITSTTFKNHALTTSPDLATFLRSVTRLTLSNLGLPFPSTHVHQLLTYSSPNLTYLALSALRDLYSPALLLPLFALLRPPAAPNLRHLRLGAIDSRQVAIIAQPDCLPRLAQVAKLEWVFPNPTRELLDATPDGVRVLVLKPRAGAQSEDKEERMQAMDQEDKVYRSLMDVLGCGALRRGGGGGVREVWWGGASGAGRRLQAAAAEDQILVRLAHEW